MTGLSELLQQECKAAEKASGGELGGVVERKKIEGYCRKTRPRRQKGETGLFYVTESHIDYAASIFATVKEIKVRGEEEDDEEEGRRQTRRTLKERQGQKP